MKAVRGSQHAAGVRSVVRRGDTRRLGYARGKRKSARHRHERSLEQLTVQQTRINTQHTNELSPDERFKRGLAMKIMPGGDSV